MFCNIKKLGVFLFVLLCFVSFVNAYSTTKELKIGESIDLSGRNVTLIALDAKEDKIVVCVNGERNIIPKYGKTVKDIFIELRKITSYYAEIRLKTAEEGTCGIECSNKACFEKKTEPIKELVTSTTTTILEEKESSIEKEAISTGEVIKEGSKVPKVTIFPLVFLGLILIITFLVAFKRK